VDRIHHPYDGGADVLLPTTAERDALNTVTPTGSPFTLPVTEHPSSAHAGSSRRWSAEPTIVCAAEAGTGN